MNDLHSSLLHKLVYQYAPSALIDRLGFSDSLRAADAITGIDDTRLDYHYYAVTLLEVLRRTYPSQWSLSWKYDAYLGYLYWMMCDFDQMYVAYTRALTKAIPDAPPQLLIEIASCFHCPGDPPIRREEAYFLALKMMKDQPYLEWIDLLIFICKNSDNYEEQKRWEEKRKELDGTIPELPPIWELPGETEEWVPNLQWLTDEENT